MVDSFIVIAAKQAVEIYTPLSNTPSNPDTSIPGFSWPIATLGKAKIGNDPESVRGGKVYGAPRWRIAWHNSASPRSNVTWNADHYGLKMGWRGSFRAVSPPPGFFSAKKVRALMERPETLSAN